MLLRHFSGRYVLLYHPSLRETVDLRIYAYQRYYIPRRLSVPLLTLEAIEAIEEAEESDYSLGRVRHPVLFPGAAYDVFGAATGLRGRILRDGLPMRWAHIEAHTVASGQLVGRARGDDRGEFLMLLSPMAALDVELNSTIDVRVSIAGPAEVPVPPTADLPALDPLWDVPLERLPPAGQNDDVSAGNQLPTGYVRSNSASREVAFHVGRVLSGVEVEAFIFSPP